LDGRLFREAAPSPTRILATATVSNITDLNRAVFDVKIDTLFSTRSDLLAYIPPSSVPNYMTLPETVLLSGTASGTLANLQSDLKLLATRDDKTSEVLVKGNIRNLSEKTPSFDIALQSGNFDRAELLAYLHSLAALFHHAGD
jgi:hypothetical protein